MNVLLISTYELGRQPFGLASPAAWLRAAGISVTCLDLSREPLGESAVRQAEFIAFYIPMHTATRLAVRVLPQVRRLNPNAHLCFYGLYAPVNEDYLRGLGAGTILGGEFEEALLEAVRRESERRLAPGRGENDGTKAPQPRTGGARQPKPALPRLEFIAPDRSGLPPLSRYARLEHPDGTGRVTGYTEASRGCKHLCRHCPVVPVYQGRFRIVQPQVVLEDVRRQVAAGAQHITFGDPDFFNGIRHALAIVTALHGEHPALTYDVTIKVEHLLKHAAHLSTLRETGCLFVTTAVESLDDRILERLQKGHTRADFLRVADLFRKGGLHLSPTLVAFTPWVSLGGYCEMLDEIEALGLVENLAPVQLGIRLLIPAGSRLLELEDVQRLVGEFNEAELVYPWKHPDPRVDELYAKVQDTIQLGIQNKEPRRAIFSSVREAARKMAGLSATRFSALPILASRASIPYLTEPWYC
ncbi:MAG TPA: CUAEP/CCAEP-tail radical SAM protein [Terriglobia bacterium]|nr:CUAEP/CCAEP-tail radical SAM protein [Terriglobia bacterium]